MKKLISILTIIGVFASFFVFKGTSNDSKHSHKVGKIKEVLSVGRVNLLPKVEINILPDAPEALIQSLFKDPERIGKLTEKEFEDLSETISADELRVVKDTVISTTENGDKRQSFIYLLTQLGTVAADSLAEIAIAPFPAYKNLHNPHSADSYQKSFETSLRITALEAMDNLAIENGSLKEKIKRVTQQQKDPSLNFLANVSLSGIESNRPGKLKRFIDATLAEKDHI